MQTENQYLLEQIQKQADEFVCKLHEIFDLLDPETSAALIQPSLDQLVSLISGKLSKLGTVED